MTPNIAPLGNVSAFIGMVDQVQNRAFGLPGMATFYGPSGWGKSTAVILAANEFQAHCIEVMETSTPTFLMQSIMDEMGLPKAKGVPAMVVAVSEHLARSNRPLILDDAQYLLQKKMIGLVRDIYNKSHGSVILVGEEKLPQDLTKWENVHNRMLTWEPAMPCSLYDAELLAPIYCKNVSVESDLLAAIVSASNGSIRRVCTNLARVQEVTRRGGKRVADLASWGDRSFHTGQPPVRPRGQEAQSAPAVVHQIKTGSAQ